MNGFLNLDWHRTRKKSYSCTVQVMPPTSRAQRNSDKGKTSFLHSTPRVYFGLPRKPKRTHSGWMIRPRKLASPRPSHRASAASPPELMVEADPQDDHDSMPSPPMGSPLSSAPSEEVGAGEAQTTGAAHRTGIERARDPAAPLASGLVSLILACACFSPCDFSNVLPT